MSVVFIDRAAIVYLLRMILVLKKKNLDVIQKMSCSRESLKAGRHWGLADSC